MNIDKEKLVLEINKKISKNMVKILENFTMTSIN